MDVVDIIGSSSLASVVGGIAYAVNKWLIPAYKGLKLEIEELRKENKVLTTELTEVKSQLSYLKGKYAEKTVLKSGNLKDKKDEGKEGF